MYVCGAEQLLVSQTENIIAGTVEMSSTSNVPAKSFRFRILASYNL
jgi:hypothetical protein